VNPLDIIGHAVRVKEILGVFARQGFGDWFEQLELPAGIWQRFLPAPPARRPPYERLRLALEQLGPAFVKAGQMLSMRPDVMPEALVLELRKLQNRVQPLPFAEMRPVLVDELGGDPAEIFAEFDETPVASASLAQVYFARLHDGSAVAVKVQRPKLRKTVETDLELMVWLVGQLHRRVAALAPFNLPEVAAEIARGVLRELDFRNEARNQRYFNAVNPWPDQVFAPRVTGELSGEKVLVMERVEGRGADDAGLAPALAREVAARGVRSLLHQVLAEGFFHADPHAGNVLVTTEGRLCFLDWGLAGHLTRRLRHALADLFLAAVEQDAERVLEIARDLAGEAAPPEDPRALERDIGLVLREDFNTTIGHVQTGRALLRLLFLLGSNGIHLSRDYSLMAKAMLSIEEIARVLDPQFDLRAAARPVLAKLQARRSGPRAVLRETRAALAAGLGGLRDLPGDLRRVLRRVERDDLTIQFQHKGLEELDDALKTASNRITLGVVIAALLVGSSLIVTTKIEPYLFGYPALGIVGYLLSALLSLYIVWDIVRHGRHK
jgi:ubiquinone biosynthesis protein